MIFLKFWIFFHMFPKFSKLYHQKLVAKRKKSACFDFGQWFFLLIKNVFWHQANFEFPMNLSKIFHSRFASSFTGKIRILVRIIRPKVVARRSTYLWMFRSCRESKSIWENSQKMSRVVLKRCQLVIFLFIISLTHKHSTTFNRALPTYQKSNQRSTYTLN